METASIVEIWSARTAEREREHQWTTLLSEQLGYGPEVRGFGSSDCRCDSHLLAGGVQPSAAVFRSLLGYFFPGDSPLIVIPSVELEKSRAGL